VNLTFDLLASNLLHIITHQPQVGNLPVNFGVSRTFVLDLSANTCQTRHVTLRPLTLEVTALVGDAGLCALSVYQV